MGKKIAVVGSGYWGKNLVRNFYELGSLKTVCDLDMELLNEFQTIILEFKLLLLLTTS